MIVVDVRFSQRDHEEHYLLGCDAMKSGTSSLTLIDSALPILRGEQYSLVRKILTSHSGDYEERRGTLYDLLELMLRRNMPPPSSG
jgi:hypothetical protein